MASQYYNYRSSKQMPCLLRNVSGMGKAYFQSSLRDDLKNVQRPLKQNFVARSPADLLLNF